MLDYARTHKLLAIGGSDFSGMYNKGTVSVGDFATPAADFKALSDYKTMIELAAKQGYVHEDELQTLQQWRRDPANWKKSAQ